MTLSLADVQVPLALFAEGIVGHPVMFEVLDDAEATWPWLPTDPARSVVTLPASLLVDDYRALVLHQLIALEDRAAGVEHERPLVPDHIDAALFAFVFATVEDARVDAVTRQRYPGAVRHLDTVLTAARRDLDSTGSAMLDGLHRYSLGDAAVEVSSAVREAVDAAARFDATAVDSHASAVALCELLQAGGPVAGDWNDELLHDVDDALALGDDGRGASLDPTATPTQVELSETAGGGQSAADMPPSGTTQGDNERDPIGGLQLPTFGGRGAGVDRRTFVYDEWDYRYSTHRRAWCRVIEEELDGDDHDFISDVRSRHMALRSQLRRTFAQLRPEDLVRVYRRIDGSELDIDGVIEAVVDRRTGAPADDRVHVRRDRAARDVATAFLVDLSASTSSPAVPPEPPEPLDPATIDPLDDPLSYAPMYPEPGERGEPERRVIDVAKDAVALMSDALHELGDLHAIYGFSGKGRDQVEFKIARDFDDRVSPRSWASIAAMKPLQYTRMGPAVRHATTKLSAQPARTRLLIVVSDGYPQDVDYGEDARDRDYGVHDTARALSDAADAGIDTFCITIDPAGHDYLRQMCAPDRYLVIDDVESLPEELARVYLRLSAR